MRYYAEWMDGEYNLLNGVKDGYVHERTIARALRVHALFGGTLVLSDAQMIDIRTPLASYFLDVGFQRLLRERPDFIALRAQPVSGVGNEKFAIAMKGTERLANQAGKPSDSFEKAISDIGEILFRVGHLDAPRLLSPGVKDKGKIGRIIRASQYRAQLTGLLRMIHYFSTHPIDNAVTPLLSSDGRYDHLLRDVASKEGVVGPHVALRARRVLEIQDEKIKDPALHGRRAALRKVLGTGKWQAEQWKPEDLRVYLDVVHAWNYVINLSVSPEAGTFYEAPHDLPLANIGGSIVDSMQWASPSSVLQRGTSPALARLLAWDPLEASWEDIAKLVYKTRGSASAYQRALESKNKKEWKHFLKEHAEKLGEGLVNFPKWEVPSWGWSLVGLGAKFEDIDDEVVEVFHDAVDAAPAVYSNGVSKWVRNTLLKAHQELKAAPSRKVQP